MANLPNLVAVACKAGPTPVTNVNVPNAALVFRVPTAQPVNLASSSGPTAPTGPQLWPLKG